MSGSARLKIKILIIELKKLVHKLHMKPTTSLYSVKNVNFCFLLSYCDLKEKYHIRRNKKFFKKEKLACEISVIIILICQKLGSVGPVQQKIKLPSPYICSYYWTNSEQLLIPVFEVYFTLRNLGFWQFFTGEWIRRYKISVAG